MSAVGCHPQTLLFTKNCDKLLVTLKGSPVLVDGEVIDPEGEVVIVHINMTEGTVEVDRTDFQAFNDRCV